MFLLNSVQKGMNPIDLIVIGMNPTTLNMTNMANLFEVNVRLSRYLITYYKLQRHRNKYSKFSSIGYVELSKNSFKIRQ